MVAQIELKLSNYNSQKLDIEEAVRNNDALGQGITSLLKPEPLQERYQSSDFMWKIQKRLPICWSAFPDDWQGLNMHCLIRIILFHKVKRYLEKLCKDLSRVKASFKAFLSIYILNFAPIFGTG